MKKSIAVLLALAMVLAGAFAQANPGDTNGVTATEVKIGSFQALSGPVAAIGVPVKKGLDAYFNWVNSKGGVFGRKINLIVADDAFNPSNTVVETKRLVESDKVFAMVAGLGAPGNLAVFQYLEDNKVPYVYQAAGAGSLTIPPKRYIFGVQPNYTTEGGIMVRYLVEQKKAKRIAVVYRNLDDGKESFASIQKALAARGMSTVEAIPVEATATDFSASVVKLMQAKPDAVIVMLFVPQSANFVKQAKSLGLTQPAYLATYANADLTFAKAAGGAAEGVETMAWVDVDFTNAKADFMQIYQATFPGEIPNAYAVAGMIAAEVFTEGLNRAGKDLTREKLVAALETMDGWAGKIGPAVSYGPIAKKGDLARVGVQTMYVLRVKGDTLERAFGWVKF